jgi:hypothetical protein
MGRYRSRRPPDAELRTKLRDLANERRRFGYRRLIILLRREGIARLVVNFASTAYAHLMNKVGSVY